MGKSVFSTLYSGIYIYRSHDSQVISTTLSKTVTVAGRVMSGPFDYFKGESRSYELAFCPHRLE